MAKSRGVRRSLKGFSMVEILLVLVLIAVLAGVSFWIFGGGRGGDDEIDVFELPDQARVETAVANARMLADGFGNYTTLRQLDTQKNPELTGNLDKDYANMKKIVAIVFTEKQDEQIALKNIEWDSSAKKYNTVPRDRIVIELD